MATKQKRREFSTALKQEILRFAEKNGVAQASKIYALTSGQVYRWRKKMKGIKQLPFSDKPNLDGTTAGDVEKAIEVDRRKREKEVPKTVASRVADITVRVNCDGLTLKMQSDSGMIGTLVLTEDGLQFVTANAKKSPQRSLPWDTLHNLMVSGLFN